MAFYDNEYKIKPFFEKHHIIGGTQGAMLGHILIGSAIMISAITLAVLSSPAWLPALAIGIGITLIGAIGLFALSLIDGDKNENKPVIHPTP